MKGQLMAPPLNNSLRTAILDSFDERSIMSIHEVQDYLNDRDIQTKYQSLRLLMLRMTREGLLVKLSQRGDRNTTYFTKVLNSYTIKLRDSTNRPISMRQFIHDVIDYKNPALDSNALNSIKVWMLDSLATSLPEVYRDKNVKYSPVDNYKAKLESTAAMLRSAHALIKYFLDSPIWNDSRNRELIAQEFKSSLVEEHSVIVDRSWLKDG
jgi:hypothetical protein